MIAIVLCAGFGTRMYPLTRERPKALLPVGGKPALGYLVEQLTRLPGLTAVHLACNARFHEQFRTWKCLVEPKLAAAGIAIQLHNNGVRRNEDRLGANGDLALVLRRIEPPAGALIAAGDNILLFDLLPIWEHFRSEGLNIVLALAEKDREKLRRTGVLVLGDDDRVVDLLEKPEQPPTNWTCPPFYFLTGEALKLARPFLNKPKPPDAMGQLIAHLANRTPIFAVKVDGRRLDIGSLDSYRESEEFISGGESLSFE